MKMKSTEKTFQTTESDWKRILNIMIRYNRESGYINILDEQVTFFDGNAIIDDVGSFYVTQSDVQKIILSFKKNKK